MDAKIEFHTNKKIPRNPEVAEILNKLNLILGIVRESRQRLVELRSS